MYNIYFYYYLHQWTIWEEGAEIMTLNISVCISNEPNIILQNSTVIKLKKFNMDTILLFILSLVILGQLSK